MSKVSEAQKRAVKKYNEKNKEKIRRESYKRTAKSFVRNHATNDEMKELIKIFKTENKNYLKEKK